MFLYVFMLIFRVNKLIEFYKSLYIYIYIFIHPYAYIYIERERENKAGGSRASGLKKT